MEPRWCEEDPWVPQGSLAGPLHRKPSTSQDLGNHTDGSATPWRSGLCHRARGEERGWAGEEARKRGEIQDSGEGVVQEKPERKPRSRSLSPVVGGGGGGGEGMGSP